MKVKHVDLSRTNLYVGIELKPLALVMMRLRDLMDITTNGILTFMLDLMNLCPGIELELPVLVMIWLPVLVGFYGKYDTDPTTMSHHHKRYNPIARNDIVKKRFRQSCFLRTMEDNNLKFNTEE